MGKNKMKLLPFPFKSKETLASSWAWPMCGNPKTISFRANDDVFKTMNSAYLDANVDVADDTPDLYYIKPFEPGSFSSVSEVYGDDSVETVIRGLRSERLFFEPGETSSILEEAKLDDVPFKESVVMAVDSREPFVDFRRSMEEMVEAHGLKDWECLEELLTCYLRVNGKSNHGYIVGAFVDLLVSLAFPASAPDTPPAPNAEDHPNCSSSTSSSITTHSFTSPLSFSSITTSSTGSPSLSLVEVDDEMEKTATTDNASSSSSS